MFDDFSGWILARRARAKLVQSARALITSLQRSHTRRVQAERQIIEDSFLFDVSWYLQRYPDVARAGADPLAHYLTVGWREGRDPGPMFTTSAYLKANEDVAKSGVNPLLHFVQFGLSEGREGFGDRHLPRSALQTPANFAAAHPCLSLVRAPKSPLIWRRSCRLNRGDPRLLTVGETSVGYVADNSRRAQIDCAVDWLRTLSGVRGGDLPKNDLPTSPSDAKLWDAWYVNTAQLRTRWAADNLPMVVRAFQSEPWQEGQPRLVGEGAIASTVDFVDLHLLNPYFPILLVFTAPGGEIRGAAILTFPSLCRGGMHYPELLWASSRQGDGSIDVHTANQELTKALVALVRGEAAAAVEKLQVDLRSADGDGSLSRGELRLWLANVLQVDVVDLQTGELQLPSQALLSRAPKHRIARAGGGTLVVSADSSPTIAALLAHRTASDSLPTARPVPLLTARIDPSKPVISIHVPAASASAVEGLTIGLPWIRGGDQGGTPANFPAGAIRLSSGKELNDAQLLMPFASSWAGSAEERSAITWLIHTEEWPDEQLAQAIQTVALQSAADNDAVAFIGPSTTAALGVAARRFPGRAGGFRTRTEAVRRLQTPLAGYIAGGVLLHDPRTADCFSSMLSTDRISTASCVVVSTEKRGGVFKTAILDGGSFVEAGGQPASQSNSAQAAVELWRSSYPVLRPSAHLWAARSDLFAACSTAPRGEPTSEAVHLCSFAVTAAYLGNGAAIPQTPMVPGAPERAARVEWLVG